MLSLHHIDSHGCPHCRCHVGNEWKGHNVLSLSPRNHGIGRNFPQLFRLGRSFIGRHSLRFAAPTAGHVDLRLLAFAVSRLFLRFPEAPLRTTRPYQPNTASSARTGLVQKHARHNGVVRYVHYPGPELGFRNRAVN